MLMINLRLIIVGVLMMMVGGVKAQQSLFVEEPVMLIGADTIRGKLMLPNGDTTSCPVALIIAGSGPTDMDGNTVSGGISQKNNSLKQLAEGLAKAGIASLRYDKRGVASSTVSTGFQEKDLRFEHYVQDAARWVEFLKLRGGWTQIVVIGHSEGSLIGMLASQQQSAVDGFVSLAGAGKPAYQIIEEQLLQQPKEIRDLVATYNSLLCMGLSINDVPNYLQALFRPSVQPYLISWYKYHPQVEIAKLNVPKLIVQGDMDIQVGVADAELLKQASPEAELCIIPGMNHVLKHCDSVDRNAQIQTYTQPNLPLHEKLVATIVTYFQKLRE